MDNASEGETAFNRRMAELLRELLSNEVKDPIFGKVQERQAKRYEAMGVDAPKTASLCGGGI